MEQGHQKKPVGKYKKMEQGHQKKPVGKYKTMVRVDVQITIAQDEQLTRASRELSQTKSYLIRDAIQRYLNSLYDAGGL